MTVYLCLFGSVLLTFGAMSILFAPGFLLKFISGIVLLGGGVTIGIAVYLRPGTKA
jgi:hypothetical protein